MKIDINNISNIKNKKQLNKYSLDKPLFLNNYLFHYLIILNNFTALKLHRFPIYKENEDRLSGFHLAAKTMNDTNSLDMLKYLIKEYPEYAGNINNNYECFLHYLPINDKIKELVEYSNKIKSNIDWPRLFNLLDKRRESLVSLILRNGSNKLILWMVSNIDIYWKKINKNSIFQAVFNDNLKDNDIIEIFEKIDKKCKGVLHITNDYGENLVAPTIYKMRYDLIKYLHRKNLKFDYYSYIHDRASHVLIYSIRIESDNNKNFKISKYIWKIIKDKHDFSETDYYKNNLVGEIFNNIFLNNFKYNKFFDEIILKCDVWNRKNVSCETNTDLIMKLDYKTFHKLIPKNAVVDYTSVPKEWTEFIKKFKKEESQTDVKLDNYKFSDNNKFNSTADDICLFLYILEQKHKNLYVPKYLKDFRLDGYWDFGMTIDPDFINYPFIIFYDDNNNYQIHPYLNMLMEKERKRKKYDFGVVFVSYRFEKASSLHAQLLIYDFSKNTIEHFNPYGNTQIINSCVDETFQKELTFNTGFDYIPLSKYLPVSGFQFISDETNKMNVKPGDIGGFCLAWCFWYLEHRILNKDVDQKILVRKLLDKLLKKYNSYSIYIRNYANHINEDRLKLLEKIGIDKQRLTNNNRSSKELDDIYDFIFTNMTI